MKISFGWKMWIVCVIVINLMVTSLTFFSCEDPTCDGQYVIIYTMTNGILAIISCIGATATRINGRGGDR